MENSIKYSSVQKYLAGCMAPLIVRIIDTNDGENSFEDRTQAFRLIRKILSVSPSSLPSCLITSLIAIVECSARPAEKSKESKVLNFENYIFFWFNKNELLNDRMFPVIVCTVPVLKFYAKLHLSCHHAWYAWADSMHF